MKKNYYAKALALTVAASMVSVPAFAAEGTDDPRAQEETVEQDEQEGEKSAIYETKESQTNAFEGPCGATEEDTLEWKLEENDDDLYEIAGEKESEWHFSTTEVENSKKVQAYTLTISGDGEMADYENYSTPWGIAIAKRLDETAEKGSMYKISPRITQIKITGNPTYIGSHAFRSTSIKEITIPASVEKIGNYALIYCRELEEIKLAGDNDNRDFYVEDGVLYENYTENGKSGVELRFYPSAKTTEEFEIPEGVTALGPNSMQTGRFSSVTFPDSLRSINSYALCACANLTSVTLPDGVTFGTEREVNVNKGVGAFSGCTSLAEVNNFPADIEAIPLGIFQGDVALTSFTIPEGIKELKDRCFSDTGITDITVPASVTTLGNGVFSGKNTEEVTVHFAKGSQLQSVGKNIFNNTEYKAIFDMADEDAIDAFIKAGYMIDMSGVTIPSDGIFQYDFAGAKKLAIKGFVEGLDGSKKEKVVIPDEVEDWAVTTIAENAFQKDYNKIKEVEIGANVSAIGSYAFATNNNGGGATDGTLEKVTFKPGVPVIVGDRAFSKYSDKIGRIFDAGDREITFGNNVFLTTPLKTVNIPNAKKLGHGVFFNVGCRKDLETLVINGSAECNTFAFKNSTNGNGLTYPDRAEYSFAGTKVYAVNAKATDVATEIKDLAANNILCLTDGGTVDINGEVDATTGLLTPKYEGSGKIFGGWYYDVDGTETKTKLTGKAVSGTTYTAKWVSGSHVVSDTEVNFENLQYGYTEVPDKKITVTNTTEGEPATVELVSKSQNVNASVEGTTVTISPKAGLDIGEYTETVRIKTGDDATHDIKVAFSVVKAEQAAPAAPEAESITRTSITLKAVEPNVNSAEAEYSIDGGKTWQKSPVFDGLSARTTYTFAVRYAETDKYAASAASEAQFTTRKKSSSSSSDTSAPTYGVSTGKTENGEISVTPTKAEAGETVTIKATPDSGYQLDKMMVKDKNNSAVKLKKVDENEYTFTMPVGKVSVDATFVQKDAADDSNAAEAGKTIKLQIGSRIVNVDNEAVIYDAAPVIRNDRTLVPIRIITEALGGKVDWNGATKEVTLSINDKEIKMTIGKTLEKYGVAPVIIDGRTFVPVRFVADELGANVAWDDATKTVTIKTAR